jgi:NAD(P)-dependent dehydrogenase (short-subunit alcohol dehydrogenase family)
MKALIAQQPQKHLLLIGGTRGIGMACLKLVASEYTAVTVISRNPPRATNEWPKNVTFTQADMLQADSLQKVLHDAVQTRGKLSGMAFFQRHRGAEGAWEGNIASTLTCTRNTIEFLKNHFDPDGDKSIVMLSSIASGAVAGDQDEGYHAAKAGLIGLCRFYAFELGALGIRVNCVSPGVLLKEETKEYILGNRQLYELYRKVCPLGRMGTAEEVASVVRFLLSGQASFITGQEITVDGGVGLQWQESLARMLTKE